MSASSARALVASRHWEAADDENTEELDRVHQRPAYTIIEKWFYCVALDKILRVGAYTYPVHCHADPPGHGNNDARPVNAE